MKTKSFYLHNSIGFLVDCKDNKVGKESQGQGGAPHSHHKGILSHHHSHQHLSLSKKCKTVASLANKVPVRMASR